MLGIAWGNFKDSHAETYFIKNVRILTVPDSTVVNRTQSYPKVYEGRESIPFITIDSPDARNIQLFKANVTENKVDPKEVGFGQEVRR